MKYFNTDKMHTNNQLLHYVFYLFMFLCGFITGTRIWTVSDIPPVAVLDLLPEGFPDIFMMLFGPAAIVLFLMLLLSLSAAGWLLLPALLYFLGTLSGIFICSLFSAPVSITVFTVSFTVSACLICTAAVLCYVSLHAHRLSQQLGSTGGRSAYIYFGGNMLVSSVFLLLSDAAFSGIICLQIFSA